MISLQQLLLLFSIQQVVFHPHQHISMLVKARDIGVEESSQLDATGDGLPIMDEGFHFDSRESSSDSGIVTEDLRSTTSTSTSRSTGEKRKQMRTSSYQSTTHDRKNLRNKKRRNTTTMSSTITTNNNNNNNSKDSGSSRTSMDDDQQHFHKILEQDINRQLLLDPSVPCNTVLDVYSAQQIQAVLTQLLQQPSSSNSSSTTAIVDEIPLFISEKIPLIEYSVAIGKVCGSCESEHLTGYGCDTTDYGYNTTHSGVLLLPVDVDPENGVASIIDTDELRTWIQMRFIALVQKENDIIMSNFGFGVLEYALFAASVGHVAIAPHKMGYGESNNAFPPLIPSSIDKKAIITSTLPLHAKAKQWVASMSNGMTTIGNEVYIMGYSEGGYSSVATADGLEKHGFKLLKVMAGAAPLKPRSGTLISSIKNFLSGKLDARRTLYLSLLGIPFSDQRPGVANYMTNQSFLNATVATAYAQLYTNKDTPSPLIGSFEPFVQFVVENYPVLLQPENQIFLSRNLLAFVGYAIEIGDTDPCMNNPGLAIALEVDKLCEALDDNDLSDVVTEATYDIELCVAEKDDLVTIDSMPDFSKLKYTIPNTSHFDGAVPCLIKFLHGTTIEKPVIRTSKPTKALKSFKSAKSQKSPKLAKSQKLKKDMKSKSP